MDNIEAVTALLERPVAYHPILAKVLKSVSAAVMLSQGIYWQRKTDKEKDGWFWVTSDQWFEQTGITSESQLTARRVLKSAGIWEERLFGLPAKMHYRVNVSGLVAVISGYLESGQPVAVDSRNKKRESPRSSGGKFRKLDAVDSRNEYTNTEITSETNSETTFPDAGAPGQASPLRGEEISVSEEKTAPAGKALPGGAPKKNWAKEMATTFDKVNEEKHRTAGLPYIAFNWKIKEPENFKHLKNLRELAIVGDFKAKYGSLPNDDELEKAIEAIFFRAWDYFKHIQGDKGGAIHYTPESIYRCYNTLKTFKNGNNNGNVKSTRNGAGTRPAETPLGRGIGLDGSPTAKWGY